MARQRKEEVSPMTSILVSSDNPSVGKEIARQVGDALDYDTVGDALLSEVVQKSGIPARDLEKVLGLGVEIPKKPSRQIMSGLVAIQATLTERLLSDNVVVAGLGAHLHVRGISHILNVRILSDVRSRAHHLAVERKIAPRAARKMLERRERRIQEWSLSTFGVDETSPSSYDMVISLGNIDEKRAVTTIVDTAGDRKFKPMTYSRKCLENLALADRVRARLVSDFPGVEVVAEDGLVKLKLAKRWFGWQRAAETLREMVGKIEGVDGVEIHSSALPRRASGADMTGS
jgi:cytidylate kinase